MMMVFKYKDLLEKKYPNDTFRLDEFLYNEYCKYLTPGKMYEVTETPTLYDPHTFQPIKGHIDE